MHFPGTEATDRGVLLSFLVQTYAQTKLLPKSGRSWSLGAGNRRKKPPEHSESRPGDRNAYGSVLYCHGNPPEHFRQLVGEIIVQPASLSKNAFQRKGIGGCTYGPPAEIFFPVYGKTAGITYNANNSEATRLVRKLLGFPGFLMVQTFHSQEYIEEPPF